MEFSEFQPLVRVGGGVSFLKQTLETNIADIAPENRPGRKGKRSYSNHQHFQVRTVSFREGNPYAHCSLLQVVLEWVKRVPKHRASQGMTGALGFMLSPPTYLPPAIAGLIKGLMNTQWFPLWP